MNPNYLPVPTDQREAASISKTQAREPAAATPRVAPEPALSIFEILLKRKWIVIACMAVALVLGVLYLLLTPPTYRTKAEIFVERNNSGQPHSPLSPRGVSAGLPSTHAALLTSTPVLEMALQSPGVADSAMLANKDDKVQALRNALAVSSSKESETVSIALGGREPEEIALVLNAVVHAYLRTQQPWLAKRTGTGDASAVAAGGNDFSNVGIMSDQLTASRLSELSSELTAAEIAANAAATRLTQARAAEGEVAILTQLLEQSGLSTQNMGLSELAYLRYERARVKTALQSLPDDWGPDHQQRKPVEREYRAIEREMQAFEESTAQIMLSMLSESHRQTIERRDELASNLQSQRASAEATAELPVRVIEPARVPQSKVDPRASQTLAIALVLGFLAGAPLAIGAELRSREEEDDEATVPREATLPQPQDATTLPARLERDEESLTGPILGVVPEIPIGRRLASPNFDASASSIHQIRAVLQVQARQQGLSAYAFTSPRRGAGKTSVTIGVATSLAMSGTRTLVVDCDLAGRIARGQNGKPGPAADPYGPISPEGSSPDSSSLDNIAVEEGYLDGEQSRAVGSPVEGDARVGVTGMLDGGTLDECAVDATVPGLSLLPAVAAQTRHIGQMSDAFVRRIIEEARGRYDLVLFDTGPIPGSTEALLVTSQVDGVILVVPQGEDRAALNRTLSYLKVVGASIVGTVFNRSKPAPDAGGAERRSKPRADPAAAPEAIVLAVGDEDDAYLDDDRTLGSGILAAAVFSDAESGYANDRWELKTTSTVEGKGTPDRDTEAAAAAAGNHAEGVDDDDDDHTVFSSSVDELFSRANGSTPHDRSLDDEAK